MISAFIEIERRFASISFVGIRKFISEILAETNRNKQSAQSSNIDKYLLIIYSLSVKCWFVKCLVFINFKIMITVFWQGYGVFPS